MHDYLLFIALLYEQVRLAEDDTVTVAATGGATHNGHDHPLRGGVAVPQIQQVEVVRGQATTCKKTAWCR